MGILDRRPLLHGSSDWSSDADLAAADLRWHRVPPPSTWVMGKRDTPLGREYLCLERGHVGVYARTRTGKDRSFVIQNILSAGDSLLVFDPKGEDYDVCSGALAMHGYEVYRFSPGARDGRTHRYNPLGYVDRWGPRCFSDIGRIFRTHIPDADGGDRSRFWDAAARDAGIGIAAILAETPGQALHMGRVMHFLSRTDGPRILTDLIRRSRASGLPYSQAAVDAIGGFLNAPADQAMGIRKALETKLDLWRDPYITAATAESDFDLRDLRRRKMAVFVAMNAEDTAHMRSLVALLFQQAINLNVDHRFGTRPEHRHRVSIVLNEMWMLDRMVHMANAASFVLDYGIRIAYVTQSKAQLREIFGNNLAMNLFANTAAEMIFGGSDWELCKEFSDRGGTNTVEERTTSKPRFLSALRPSRQSTSEHIHARPLLLPQEVEAIPGHRCIVRAPGFAKAVADKVDSLTDPLFASLRLEPVPVQEIEVDVPRDDGLTPLAGGHLVPNGDEEDDDRALEALADAAD